MFYNWSFSNKYTCISLKNVVLILLLHKLIIWFKWQNSLIETIYSISSQNKLESYYKLYIKCYQWNSFNKILLYLTPKTWLKRVPRQYS